MLIRWQTVLTQLSRPRHRFSLFVKPNRTQQVIFSTRFNILMEWRLLSSAKRLVRAQPVTANNLMKLHRNLRKERRRDETSKQHTTKTHKETVLVRMLTIPTLCANPSSIARRQRHQRLNRAKSLPEHRTMIVLILVVVLCLLLSVLTRLLLLFLLLLLPLTLRCELRLRIMTPVHNPVNKFVTEPANNPVHPKPPLNLFLSLFLPFHLVPNCRLLLRLP
ncbi:MAG: hypothetical protein AAFQ62_16730 [Pseudomonadota bacterium]